MDFVRIAFMITGEYEDLVIRRRFGSFTYDVAVSFLCIRVEVYDRRIGCVIFTITRPIFPSFVPAFCRRYVGSINYNGISMAFRIDYVNEVFTIQFNFKMIYGTGFRTNRFVYVDPKAFSNGRIPPCTCVFRQFGPKNNIYGLAEFIRIRNSTKNRGIAYVVASSSHAPQEITQDLRMAFVPFYVQYRPKFRCRIFIIRVRIRAEVVGRDNFIRVSMWAVVYFRRRYHLCAYQ